MATGSSEPLAKIPRQDTDFSLCLMCQKETSESLVSNPKTHTKVLKLIKELATYGEGNFPEINRRLGNATVEFIVSQGATWHRTCHQETCHKSTLEMAKARYELLLTKRKESNPPPIPLPVASNFTRSQSNPYDSNVCFFCEKKGSRRSALSKVLTDAAGRHLHSAIEKSNNDNLRVKLSTAINPNDAHAIDIRYHNRCWTSHVTNVLRRHQPEISKDNTANEIAADIEFISLVEEALFDGEVLTMANLHQAYVDIRSANCVKKPDCSRKKVKNLLENEIHGVEFHTPKRLNESALVSLKDMRDTAIQIVSESQNANVAANMKILFDASFILRQAITKTKAWEFTGTLTDITNEHVPSELYTFFRWILQGHKSNLKGDIPNGKKAVVDKHAKTLAQSTVSYHLSDRQVKRKSDIVRHYREMPVELGIGISLRQAIRGKKVINLLHGFGISVAYERLQKLETQIANSVLRRMQDNDGVYIPANVVPGRHIFFAVDNVDFSEDTPNGKRTLHGTVMAIYQRRYSEDVTPMLELTEKAQMKTIKQLPSTITELLPCKMPKSPKPRSPRYPTFVIMEKQQPSITYKQDMAWLVGKTLANQGTSREQQEVQAAHEPDDAESSDQIPTWAAYNSLVSTPIPLTYVNTPPLIAAPAHEWPTLLTILKQAQGISAKVVGPQRKTVVTLDMGLYKPAKQLQMARNDCSHLILRPGELHSVMAQLRTIGSYMDNSGLDLCWVEAELYGTATVKQILEGRHVKRGITAHLTTLQALFSLYADAFFKVNPELVDKCTEMAQVLNKVCADDDDEAIQRAHGDMIQAMESLGFLEKMSDFDNANCRRPLAQAFHTYMQMVLDMMVYIRAVRTGDWKLHLAATETFVKYYFAHDKLNYARLIPVYLADMHALAQSDPEIWEEFMDGNWVVNKNEIPFCAIGPDHALEQVNRSMKVSGGLVGITLNEFARTKFFLVAPELARLATEAETMAGISTGKAKHHHEHTEAKSEIQKHTVHDLIQCIREFTNPFTVECDEIINLVTKAVVSDKIQKDINMSVQVGEERFAQFVKERITTGEINLWAPLKKQNLQMWSSAGMKVKLKMGDQITELKEDRALFARLLIVSKARDINMKDAVGTYEFSVVPRAMFAADGSLFHVTSKSDLMGILEELPVSNDDEEMGAGPEAQPDTSEKRVAIVDGMADLQALDKPEEVKTCHDLANHFIERHWQKYNDYDEVHLVFDRYDIGESLKAATREKRLASSKSTKAIPYRITDTTSIAKTSMRSLLAHVKTKDELTTYLANKIFQHAEANGKCLVVTWRDQAKSTHREIEGLASTQEEADTKLILHSLNATQNGATSIRIYSPDTDVLVLAIRRYPNLCIDTCFVTGVDTKRRVIPLAPIYNALGAQKAASLPGFHALSGADVTGRFAGKGKLSFWKVLKELGPDDDKVHALSQLGVAETPSEDTISAIEAFICQLYLPHTELTNVADVRWYLFKKKQAQSEGLPPTRAALLPAIMRAHYQAMIWYNDIVPNPELPRPNYYGWDLLDGKFKPVMTSLPPAPDAVIHLVKCDCAKSRCVNNLCKCRKNGLNCTDLCGCSIEFDECENAENVDINNVPILTDEDDDRDREL